MSFAGFFLNFINCEYLCAVIVFLHSDLHPEFDFNEQQDCQEFFVMFIDDLNKALSVRLVPIIICAAYFIYPCLTTTCTQCLIDI